MYEEIEDVPIKIGKYLVLTIDGSQDRSGFLTGYTAHHHHHLESVAHDLSLFSCCIMAVATIRRKQREKYQKLP
jgi:hypothetical protein